MPNEDDRFGDVADQLKQTEERVDLDDDERADTQDEPQLDEEITTEDTESETESVPEQDEEDMDESTGGPAFSFDETDMHGFYVREETWNGVTRMRSSVTAACSCLMFPNLREESFKMRVSG